ncbi:MAG: FtsX-like permease family protein [Maritimibacter sp.]
MARSTPPFSRFEFMIAWRYLRARRAEGGVSVMTWISLVGIMLAVAALIITLAVRTGFRAEFVDTILGANAHITTYSRVYLDENGQPSQRIRDYDDWAEKIAAVPGVTHAAPLIKGQVMANRAEDNSGVQVFGIRAADLADIPRIANPETAQGSLDDFTKGIAIGTTPRVNAYEVTYIFSAGRWDIDRTRVYLPLAEAQSFFNRDGVADEIEVMVENPDNINAMITPIMQAVGNDAAIWTWKDSAGSFLRALTIEDNVMFVILALVVLIASMNIVSGLVMLVKNKGRDIGILRTMGLTEGSVLRVFFLVGASTGVIGTLLGVVLGVLFSVYIDQIFALVNYVAGGGVWDPSIRGIYELPAEVRLHDVLSAVGLALGLSFLVTILPARRAARMNPVEALRYE